MDDIAVDELKDYKFIYDKLDEKFARLPEEQKIAFCRSLKEAWSSPVREVFEDVMRIFYEEAALRAKTLEELNALRQAIVIFLRYKTYIEGKISLFQQKIAHNDVGESALKNL